MSSTLRIDAPVSKVRWIGGGVGSATHAVSYADGFSVVIKRYPSDPDAVRCEWERLTFAHAAGLPVPEPIGVDLDGAWFGCPTVVMARMAGRADLAPSNHARYVSEVVAALATIHAVDVSSAEGCVSSPHFVDTWIPPDEPSDGVLDPSVADRLLGTLVALHPWTGDDVRVFNHGDFHPGNLLWSRGKLTGVVDWSGARVGYRGGEVAYFANEAELLLGAEVGDAIQHTYVAQVAPIENVITWRVLWAYAAHRYADHYLVGWREQGRRDLTIEIVTTRLVAMVERLLRDFG